uniref:Centromere protein H n=1 Tax=Astyanax mexicanus TaxID=7994 RepID=A0A3B1IK42_ASTMX
AGLSRSVSEGQGHAVNNPQKAHSLPHSSLYSPGVKPRRCSAMKDIMGNQCFEMNIKVNMGKSCDSSKCENAIEQARVSQFNKTLALNRMQVWNAVIEKILQNNADDLYVWQLLLFICLTNFHATLLQETRELQDQITDIQKERLEMKGLIKKKMQEITELKKMGENQGQAQKQAVERAENILQKYRKIATISQNVLRGIILATKVNWINDPKLKDVIVGLENIPD